MSKPSDYQDPHCPECARLRGQVAALSDALGELMDQVADMPADPEDCYAAWGACRAALSETASTAQAWERAVAEREREACAQIAEAKAKSHLDMALHGEPDQARSRESMEAMATRIAIAIRSRGSPQETPDE